MRLQEIENLTLSFASTECIDERVQRLRCQISYVVCEVRQDYAFDLLEVTQLLLFIHRESNTPIIDSTCEYRQLIELQIP